MKARKRMLKAALRFAKHGWPVLPLHSAKKGHCSCGNADCQNIGKHPRTAHGVKDATTDTATIRAWWKKWPKANIGIATGKRSGIVVLDSDPRHDGPASLRHLEQDHGALPKCPKVRTGGDGRHFYFQYIGTPIKSKSGIVPGLDIRGDGGYVVAPPSRHASGKRYRWLEGAHPDQIQHPAPPEWLLALMTQEVTRVSKAADGPIPKGQRNTTLASIAGAIRRKDVGEDEILRVLSIVNQKRCQPPLSDDEVARIAASISQYPPATKLSGKPDSQATQLVALACDVKLFHTSEMEAFGSLKVGTHIETWRLRDVAFKRWLASLYFKQFKKAPSSQSILDALGVLEGIAFYEGPGRKVFTRLAKRKKAIYVDLCDESWRAIKITAKGWKVVSNPPIKFRRARGMKPLPEPVHGGSINELRHFLNVADDKDFLLTVAWVLAALNPRGPYPVLVLLGEAGSGKTTRARVVRDLIDPNTAPVRREPREGRDLMITARNSWCTVFDNISHLSPQLSDDICRLATGGGFATRELYTDSQEMLFDATRPVLLTGIEGIVTRGDLLDRSLIIYLPAISDKQRESEKDFWRRFRRAQPRILGALLDAVSCALRRLRKVKLDHLPRMADFAHWATAAEPALGWAEGTFMLAYDANRLSANSLTLDASPIVLPLRRVCAGREHWSGTAAELLRELVRRAKNEDLQQRYWPKNAQVLSGQLRRIAPSLRATGLDIQFGEKTSGSGSKRIISVTSRVPVEPDGSEDEIDELLDHIEAPDCIRRSPRYPLRYPRLDPDARDASDSKQYVLRPDQAIATYRPVP